MRRMTVLLLLFLMLTPSARAGSELDALDPLDEAAVWEALMRPITVLDVGERETVYPLDKPGGERLFDDKMGGYIFGQSAGVTVLGADEGGYTLIEGRDDHDRLLRGYVRTRLLKKKKPNPTWGLVIDKLAQRLYVYKEGKMLSSLMISTGLVNENQPYNETASGEYLIQSWVGGFDSEGMWCDMGIRFNGGDLLHLVPCLINKDGTKNYSPYEPLLGSKASHGCVRVQRLKSPEGLNMRYLWENLKKNTKVLVLNREGQTLPIPHEDTALYYNPDRGESYHADPNCPSVRERYLPLKPFTYGELEEGAFAELYPCSACQPPLRASVLNDRNAESLAS